jgi:hypothetical protein
MREPPKHKQNWKALLLRYEKMFCTRPLINTGTPFLGQYRSPLYCFPLHARSTDVPVDIGFLCDKAAVLEETIRDATSYVAEC